MHALIWKTISIIEMVAIRLVVLNVLEKQLLPVDTKWQELQVSGGKSNRAWIHVLAWTFS